MDLNGILGNSRRAIDDYTRAVQPDPRKFQSFNDRGVQLARQNHCLAPVADYYRALRINTRLEVTKNNRKPKHLRKRQLNFEQYEHKQDILLCLDTLAAFLPLTLDSIYSR